MITFLRIGVTRTGFASFNFTKENIMETQPYKFEQDRKQFCQEIAYYLRNPKLSNEERKKILEDLRDQLGIPKN